MLAFGASRRACRPTAVCTRRQIGNHTRPASREACRRAAVTPQPSRFPSSTPAPHGRGVGCRGTPPVASRQARRRAAAWGTNAAGTRGHPPNFPKAPYLSLLPCAPTARSPGLRDTAPYWLRGWRAMVSSMICLRSSSLMPARISLMESIRGLPLARPTAMDVSPSATVKPSPSSKDR